MKERKREKKNKELMICRLGLEDADEGKWALGEVRAFDLSVSTEIQPADK